MYDVSYFKAKNEEDVVAFMKDNPFVTICSFGKDGFPVATQVPIIIEERNGKLFFLAHTMRKQEHTNAFEENSKVLVVFLGSNAYISAKNYENQATASTWNYKSVHCKGILKIVEEEKLVEILTKLTHRFEKDVNSPALVEKMDPAYVNQHIKAIVGFEIEVIDLKHVFKLSQNKNSETQQKIVEDLQQSNNPNNLAMGKEILNNNQ